MTYQCRFVNFNKCTTLLRVADSGGSCACVGQGRSLTSAQFGCESKVALKNKVYENEQKVPKTKCGLCLHEAYNSVGENNLKQ